MALYKKEGSYLLEEDEQGILDYIETHCGKDFAQWVEHRFDDERENLVSELEEREAEITQLNHKIEHNNK